MKRYSAILIMMLCTVHSLFAQKGKADEYYKLYQYEKAIPLYEKYATGNRTDYAALKNLATCYQLTNKVDKASETYKSVVALPESNADDVWQLVQMLRIQQNIPEAQNYAARYKNITPGKKADNLILSLNLYDKLMEGANEYTVTDKTPQYKSSVFGVATFRNLIIVTAENNKSNTSNWTGRGYTDLFSTDESFNKLAPFAKEIMINLDDGTPTFTDNGNTMYYTTVHDDFTKNENINTQKLKIGIAHFDGTKWSKGAELPFNSIQYKTAHPAVNKEGNLLIFASDMPGGAGGMDLYLCTKQGGSWSQPVNLSVLNTTENELFPSFNNNGDLVFSSNGLPGLGGLDLFTAKRNGNTFDAPVNMKAPFNSSYDDFCFYSDNNMKTGYISSNRYYDPQIDHILFFEKLNPVVPQTKKTGLVVNVLDKYTRTPLPYVTIIIKDQSGTLFHQGLSDPDGRLELDEIPRGAYTISGMLNEVSTTIAKVSDADFDNTGLIVKELLHNDPRFTLTGRAVNTKTKAPLEGVSITCTNTTSGIKKTTTTGADGKFFFQLEQSSDFEVQGQKKGWLSSEVAKKTTKGLDRSQQLYVNLELNIEQPTDKGTIVLKNIHYDYDKCDIRPDAAIELNRLINLLNDYPDMLIELSSHTDSRGSDAYNMKLSQCRAESAVAYLIGKGIGANRLRAKGYGETRLLNGCHNGVECTDLQHEENRRTEFTILTCPSCPK